ncbi:MAG: PD40 domain-containing protein, partial [Chitinivibrionales bacterium]|nr:PD40 domain-containing protein [Chitinivibrionales bacterium]
MANRTHRYMPSMLVFSLLLAFSLVYAKQHSQGPTCRSTAFRSVSLQTSATTQPGVAVPPDGSSIIFTLLGHLFMVPITGGEATQLTSGFSYDSDPALSPDGKKVVFISDRDSTGGSVYVLNLETHVLTRVSRELQAGMPRWSPDGQTIAYFRYLMRDEYPQIITFFSPKLYEVRTVSADGTGKPTVAAPADAYTSLFYLPDGRLGWSIPDPVTGCSAFGGPCKIFIEARNTDGTVSILDTLSESPTSVIPSPGNDGYYYSTNSAIRFTRYDGDPTNLVYLSDGAACQIAISANGSTLFFGDAGMLWCIGQPSGSGQVINFNATVNLDIRNQTEPLAWNPPAPGSVSPRMILSPQISPDHKRLVFTAAGFIYEQPLNGGQARRLFSGDAFERDPAFSPNGKKIAYAVNDRGKRELRIYDFKTKQTKTLYTVGGACWAHLPAWSPDGERIVFQTTGGMFDPYRIIIVTVASGETQEIFQTNASWTCRPHFSSDGSAIYFTDRPAVRSAIYRLSLQPGSLPEALTDLGRHVNDGLISPNGHWLAFRRNTKIWVAPLGTTPIRQAQLQCVARNCSRSFSFTPEGSALIYSAGNRIWKQPLCGGDRVEIPVNLTLSRQNPEPLLIRNIKVLNLDAGFGNTTSMLIKNGKISWIGAEQEHTLPPNCTTLDGEGRYAIPG